MEQSLRLQALATKYTTYLDQFYARDPKLAIQPYSNQHASLIADGFGAPETRSVAFAEAGYEISHIFANAKPMQKVWAQENGLAYDEANWLLDITKAQVKAFSPDILFVTDYSTFTADFLRELKIECPSIRLVLGWCGAPYRDPTVFREYDLVLSNIPELVRHFRENGHRCHHINHAFDPRILERIDMSNPLTTDFIFLGSIIKGSEFHNQREKLILELVQETNLQLWSEVRQPSLKKRVHTKLRQVAYDTALVAPKLGVPHKALEVTPIINKTMRWRERPDLHQYIDNRIARRTHHPLFGLAMFQQVHNSKVTLNTHIDISATSASNMRLFEATGVGTCLLTDWKDNLANLFVPNKEVVTYRSTEECIEKVRYLLDHDDERKAIAAAGQSRTLKDHTVQQRVEQIDEIIRTHLKS